MRASSQVQKKQKHRNSSKSSSKSSKTPTTMEELLSQTGYEPHGLKRGQEVKGIVVSITPKEILVDIGAKSEGLVLERDRRLYDELISRFSVGDDVTAVIISPEAESGHPILSLRRELMDQNWNTLAKFKEEGEEVEVVGSELTRGGLIVDVLGTRGFIPLSHLDLSLGKRPESYLGQTFKVKILDLDRDERRIVLSQKGTLVDSKRLRALLDKLEIGAEYEAIVSGITSFGLFVKIPVDLPAGEAGPSTDGEVEGLVHISEVSWEKVEDIGKMFSVGDKVRVLLIGIDKENLKINLSLKQLTADPWQEVAQKFAKEQHVRGTVSKISPFGVFVALEEGIDGLIHRSKIPVGKEFTVGEEVECVVESVEKEKRRIALVPLLKAKPVGYR